MGRAADVGVLSRAKSINNNTNNNYCFSMCMIIADLFECIKLKKIVNLSTVN